MSSRFSGSSSPGVPGRRQDEERRRDEVRSTNLQAQVDELRAALRELASRQVRIEEGLKQYEGNTAQNRLFLEQIRSEANQSAQARALDENRTRQLIADLDQRLDDALRPIRSLQAHVNELLEASRKKVDDSGQTARRFEELQNQIDHLHATVDRAGVTSHQMRDTIDGVRAETEQIRRDIFRNDDAIKIVDQESRRRVAEVALITNDFTARLDELRSDLVHAFDSIEEVKRSIVHIDPAIDELRSADSSMKAELGRLQVIGNERHDLLSERIDDQRIALVGDVNDLRANIEQRHERLVERIESSAEQFRELGSRLSAFALQIEELRLVDSSLRRDLWGLHEQRVRLRIDQAQAELDMLTGSRRDAEAASNSGAQSQRALDT